jgi:hypothetical protein
VGWESQVLGRGLSNRELSDADDDDDGADEMRVVKCGVQKIYLFRLSRGRNVVVDCRVIMKNPFAHLDRSTGTEGFAAVDNIDSPDVRPLDCAKKVLPVVVLEWDTMYIASS